MKIDAVQFIDWDYGTLCAIGSLGIKPIVKQDPLRLEIRTTEGIATVNQGEWIIKSEINGLFYICKPDIFDVPALLPYPLVESEKGEAENKIGRMMLNEKYSKMVSNQNTRISLQ